MMKRELNLTADDQEREFECPLSLERIDEAVFLKEANVHVDKKSIIPWIEKHGTCPFTRTPLTIEDLQPAKSDFQEALEIYKKYITEPTQEPETKEKKKRKTNPTNNHSNESLLMLAAKNGVDIIKHLLTIKEVGADINAKDLMPQFSKNTNATNIPSGIESNQPLPSNNLNIKQIAGKNPALILTETGKAFSFGATGILTNHPPMTPPSDKPEPQLSDLNARLQLYPANVQARLQRAKLYERHQNIMEAIEDYEFVIARYPENAQAHQALEKLLSGREGTYNQRDRNLRDIDAESIKAIAEALKNSNVTHIDLDPPSGDSLKNMFPKPRR